MKTRVVYVRRVPKRSVRMCCAEEVVEFGGEIELPFGVVVECFSQCYFIAETLEGGPVCGCVGHLGLLPGWKRNAPVARLLNRGRRNYNTFSNTAQPGKTVYSGWQATVVGQFEL